MSFAFENEYNVDTYFEDKMVLQTEEIVWAKVCKRT